MAYISLYFVFFLLSGRLIAGTPAFRSSRALLAPAFSLALLTVDFLVLRALDAPPSFFMPVFAVELCVLLLWALRRARRRRRIWEIPPPPRRRRAWDLLWPGLILLAGMAVYLSGAGPYLEAPADVWEHLRRYQVQAACLRADTFNLHGVLSACLLDECGKLDLWLTQKGNCWYFFHALLCRLSGISVMRGASSLAFLNTMLWTAGIYLFGLKLYAPLRLKRTFKAMMAALSAVFFVLHFGVGIFAYARYYALAPTMPAYLVYLAGMSLILDLTRGGVWRWRYILAPAFLFMVLNVMHTQEALFLFFMAWGVSLVETARRLRACRCAGVGGWRCPLWHAPAVVLSGAGFVAWLGLFAASHHRPLSPFWVHAAVPIQGLLPFLRGMLVQSPVSHFYPVVTVWGILVYGLFICRRREFTRMPFVAAGMLMPLLTVFNPVTVDIMLRHFVDPLALYRFNYMLPLPFVAGYCIARFRPAGRLPRRTRMFYAAAWLGLLVLLLPVRARIFVSDFSRWPTLRRVMPGNDWRHWRDLIEMMAEQPGSSVITDPVTAYILRGATHHEAVGQRFDSSAFSWWLCPTDPEMDLSQIPAHLAPNRRWLLIVNLRDGAISRTGRLSGHWPADVLRISQCYAPRTLDWVAAHPDIFHALWNNDRVRVYEFRPP